MNTTYTSRYEKRVRDAYQSHKESGGPTYILGIETSCDETSAAVVKDGREVLSNVIASQADIHKRFGGVVPEVASRRHVENITLTIEKALAEAGKTMDDIQAIAVTYGPGLVGALLVGVASAKAISLARGIPLIGVHHIAGHIYANRLVQEMEFPLIALVVSGGHTELVWMKEHGHFEILGETRDDAAGEAYDKVARALGLPYPGGPHIDRLAHEGEANVPLPRSWLEADSYDFSFSGLKSAVLNTLHNALQRGGDDPSRQSGCQLSGFRDRGVGGKNHSRGACPPSPAGIIGGWRCSQPGIAEAIAGALSVGRHSAGYSAAFFVHGQCSDDRRSRIHPL